MTNQASRTAVSPRFVPTTTERAQLSAIFSHLADDHRRQIANNVPSIQTRMLVFRPPVTHP